MLRFIDNFVASVTSHFLARFFVGCFRSCETSWPTEKIRSKPAGCFIFPRNASLVGEQRDIEKLGDLVPLFFFLTFFSFLLANTAERDFVKLHRRYHAIFMIEGKLLEVSETVEGLRLFK